MNGDARVEALKRVLSSRGRDAQVLGSIPRGGATTDLASDRWLFDAPPA